MKVFSIITSTILYLISLYFILESFSIEYIDARIFPQVVSIILIILTTLYLVKGLKEKGDLKGNIKRVIWVGLLSGLYILFTPILGYFVTTPIIIFLIMLYLGMHNIKILILNPIISTLLIYIVFVKFFKIPVP